MKKIFISSALLLIFSGSIFASVCISNNGNYENGDIKFSISYNWGNSTPLKDRPVHHFSEVKFTIESKKGFNIFNNTYFVFEGRQYIFNSRNINNCLYQEGYRSFEDTSLKNGTIIKLVYEIDKEENLDYLTTRKVEKKFRILLPEETSKWNNVLKIIEI